MYPPETHLPVNRSEEERASAHPVFGAFMQERVSLAFTNDTTRSRVIGAYMGLVKQIDDQMGVLLDFLDNEGLSEDTLIVFTSDHGDYLGDHWMGEKELFHDPSARVPLIVVDPSPEADKTRGTKSDALIEAIDLAPTFLDWYGGEAKPHILEGHSLLPVLHGHTDKLRNVTISEYDYSMRGVRNRLGLAVRDARLTMVFDGRWKFIWAETFRPMLYDLLTDPNELVDLGADPAFEAERVRLERALFDWSRRQAQRVTISDTAIAARDASPAELRAGILIGYRNEAEYKEALETASTQPKS
jgi:arylsulfatase A-like enzyme